MVGFGCMDDVLNALEGALKGRQYLAGDSFTAADLYIASHLTWGMNFGTIEKRPVFEAYAERHVNRPAAPAGPTRSTTPSSRRSGAACSPLNEVQLRTVEILEHRHAAVGLVAGFFQERTPAAVIRAWSPAKSSVSRNRKTRPPAWSPTARPGRRPPWPATARPATRAAAPRPSACPRPCRCPRPARSRALPT